MGKTTYREERQYMVKTIIVVAVIFLSALASTILPMWLIENETIKCSCSGYPAPIYLKIVQGWLLSVPIFMLGGWCLFPPPNNRIQHRIHIHSLIRNTWISFLVFLLLFGYSLCST